MVAPTFVPYEASTPPDSAFPPALRPLSISIQESRVGLRLIAVRTEAEAAALRAQIQTGVSFEELAKAHSIDPSGKAGGYMGLVQLSDLKPEFQRALDGLPPGRVSPVTRVDGEFVLLQRLNPDEANWTASNDAGLQAIDQGRYEDRREFPTGRSVRRKADACGLSPGRQPARPGGNVSAPKKVL